MVTLFALFLSALAQAADAPATHTRLKLVVPLEAVAPIDQELAAIVRDFNASRSDVQVDITKGGSPFENLRAIIAAHYATDLPDLAIIATADLPTLDALDIVQPMPAAWVAGKKLSASFSAGKCRKGEPCSLPFQRSVPVWFFNRELLFKLGQATDRIPTNWPKLGAFARAHFKPGEVWGVAVPQSGEGAIQRWTALGLNPGLTADSIGEWVSRMWGEQIDWLPGNPGSEEVTRLFLEQRTVIMLGTLAQLPFLETNATFRIGAALPEGTDLAWFGTDAIVLSKGKSGALAREFLDYAYQPAVSLRLLKAASTIPLTRLQAEDAGWHKEISARSVLRAASTRKLKRLTLERIAPQSREDVLHSVWESVEKPPEAELRHAAAEELKVRLQKKLSTNPR